MGKKCGENDDEIQQEAQLSKILIEYILQNFPSKSYMDRYSGSIHIRLPIGNAFGLSWVETTSGQAAIG